MKTVILYSFRGKFVGEAEYEYCHPEINETHKCMLFISQNTSEPEFINAEIECKRYGFSEIENLQGNHLKVEVLNSEKFKNFAPYYEEALKEGSSLVFYPNT